MFLCGFGADRHAIFVIGFACAEQDPLIAGELCAHFENDALRTLSDGGHGERGEEEGQHGADEHADENDGVGNIKSELKIQAVLSDERLDLHIERRKQGQGGEHGGADGEAFARGGSGIAERIECVGASADGFVHAGHLRNAAGVVGYGAVGVGGEGDAECGKHADGGDADAEHTVFTPAERIIRAEHGCRNDKDGRESGEHTERCSVDDDGACAALGGIGELFGWRIGSACKKFCADSDQNTGGKPDEYGYDDDGIADTPQEKSGSGGGCGCCEPRSRAERAQKLFLSCTFFGAHEKSPDDGEYDPDGSNAEWDKCAEEFEACGDAERHGREKGTYVRFIEIGAHACDVSDVVADVIGDDGGIAAIVFRNIFFHFTDKVCADVGGFREDPAPDAGKECHAGSAHAEGDHVCGDECGFGEGGAADRIEAFENEIPYREIAKSQSDHDKSHDAAGGKSGAQAFVETALRRGGGTGVGGGGDLHAQKTGKTGEKTAGEEREGHKRPYESYEGENAQKYKNTRKKDGNHDVLPFQKGVGAFAYDRGNTFGLFAFGHFKNFSCKNEREKQRQDGGAGCDQNRIFHCFPLKSG